MQQKIQQVNNWDETGHFLVTDTINWGEWCQRQTVVCSQLAVYSFCQTRADLWSWRSQLCALLLLLLYPSYPAALLPFSLNPLWYPKQHLIVKGLAGEGVIRWEHRQGGSHAYTLAKGRLITLVQILSLANRRWGMGEKKSGRRERIDG